MNFLANTRPSAVRTRLYRLGLGKHGYRIDSPPNSLRFRFNPFKSYPDSSSNGFCNNSKAIIKLPKDFVPSGALPAAADKRLAVVGWSAITLLLAVGNRVLQKLALVSLKDYPFFLAQVNSFVYTAVSFTVLFVRYRVGITTDEMLALPKAPFAAIGIFEGLSVVSGMYAGAMLPGPAIPLLYQTILVWQLIFSSVFLRKRYSLNQILGCFLVGAGVVVAVTSGGSHGRMLSGVGLLWPALMVASGAFQAGASISKESIFVGAAACLEGKSLDTFVVNAFGSGFQFLFMLLLLPIVANTNGLTLAQLPSYFKGGLACFLNLGTNALGGNGAPLLPTLYIASNILFHVCFLKLLRVSDAIIASLAARSSVPIAMYVLSLPLPYLPKGVRLSPFFHLGSMILVMGLILYNLPKCHKEGIA